MSALLSFSERKTFARCFEKSLAARLRCSSDLLGVGGAARSLFPKNIGCNPHFSGALYMSALLSFSERKTFARCFEKSLAARLRCSSDLLGVGGAARSLFPKNIGCNPHFSGALYMSALLSFSERKTFARCFEKSLAARLRCSSDLLGVGGAARSLFPKNIGCNPHFSGALYMSALLSFSERKTFARCFEKSLAARLRCSSDLLGVGGAARSLFPKNIGCNPHFSGVLYMSALLSFKIKIIFTSPPRRWLPVATVYR